jgi:RNA polymerase sigma factor (sigma-70 family)
MKPLAPNPSLVLLEEHSGFIRNQARYYSERFNYPLDDLLQIGRLAVLRAARTYRPGGGVKFLSYAAKFVRGNMQREVAKHLLNVRGPIGSFGAGVVREVSLDAPVTAWSDEDRAWEDLIGGDEDVREAAYRAELREKVGAALDRLNPTERGIMRLWLYQGLDCAAIGRRRGVTQQAVHHRIKRILPRLRHWLKEYREAA